MEVVRGDERVVAAIGAVRLKNLLRKKGLTQ